MKILKFRHKNGLNIEFFEKCSSNLKKRVINFENSNKNNKIKPSFSLFLVALIILAGMGLASGPVQLNTGATAVSNPTVYAYKLDSNQKTMNQPTWHEVAVYRDPDRGVMNFKIQGQSCKVVVSATPPADHQENILNVDLLKNNRAITNGLVSWTSTEPITTKETIIEASRGPGNYQINIYVTRLKNWSVTVYDYY